MKNSVHILGAIAFAMVCATAFSRIPAPQDDYSKALQEREDLKKEHASKEFSWVDKRAGDCHMSGILTIFDNGYAIWTASTKTDHTTNADIWHETLEVQNSQNQRLFGFGKWDSPGMVEGSEYNWAKRDRFPAGFYQDATGAVSDSEC